MRFIPRKTKVKVTIWKNFSILDCVLILIGMAIAILLTTINLFDQWIYNVYVGLFFAGMWAMLFLEMGDDIRFYNAIILSFKFAVSYLLW